MHEDSKKPNWLQKILDIPKERKKLREYKKDRENKAEYADFQVGLNYHLYPEAVEIVSKWEEKDENRDKYPLSPFDQAVMIVAVKNHEDDMRKVNFILDNKKGLNKGEKEKYISEYLIRRAEKRRDNFTGKIYKPDEIPGLLR